jgi:hypothetical protein
LLITTEELPITSLPLDEARNGGLVEDLGFSEGVIWEEAFMEFILPLHPILLQN